ncbi:hypothetical protein [Candidatus Rickettsia colombianensi]|uniref:hypothetical protein n=1 Tax=Candidatus Rickettsia colombianensi TaxID=1090944 RepID=UPI001FE998CA|nr:hypothetical protein [Candidatus Rickettsia colombianensi]
MSAKHAIAQTRDIIKNYKYVLPDSYPIDYDTTNVQNGHLLLIREGNILIKWLSENLNNFKLENIAQSLDIMVLVQFNKGKNIDNISALMISNIF